MDFTSPSSQTQLANIERIAGRPLSALKDEASARAESHSERRARFMETYGLGHVHADTLARWCSYTGAPSADEATELLYFGAKAALRPTHTALIAGIDAFGGTYSITPKKGYLSLRRSKQFLMITPMAKEIALGLNARGLEAAPPLKALPPGKLCQYEVRLSSPEAVDARLLGWVETAFAAAA